MLRLPLGFPGGVALWQVDGQRRREDVTELLQYFTVLV